VLIGDLIIVRHRGKSHIGMLQAFSKMKIKIATSANRVIDISARHIIYSTNINIENLSGMTSVRYKLEKLAESFNLEEVWNILKEDRSTVYTSNEIGDLYWGAPPSKEEKAAMLLHLCNHSIYFSESDSRFKPRTAEELRILTQKSNQQQNLATERKGFECWLTSDTPSGKNDLTKRQSLWLSLLQKYVIHGDELTEIKQVRDLLKELPLLSGVDAQKIIFQCMVRKGIWDEDEHLDLQLYDIPTEFSEEVIEYASSCHIVEQDREDLTDLVFLSIDDSSTQDIDDALSAERLPFGYRIGVHIADVSSVIPKGSILDFSARERMSSLYLPDRHIPMLPPILSQDFCALIEGKKRCAISFFFLLSENFDLVETRIVPSIIINRARLSYDKANRLLGSIEQPFAEILQILNQAADAFYQQRIDHNAVELERNVVSIKVDDKKHINIISRDTSSRSEHIVSELMILANKTAAEYLNKKGVPAIYRTQTESDFGDIEQTNNDTVYRFLMLRKMKPLELSLKSKPHASLGVDTYCQITSPIRRYTDLVLQRQLIDALQNKDPTYNTEEMMDELSFLERSRILTKIQSRREWYWLLKYLEKHDKEPIRAIVLEVRERDILVEFPDFGSQMAVKVTQKTVPGEEIKLSPTVINPWTGTLRLRHN